MAYLLRFVLILSHTDDWITSQNWNCLTEAAGKYLNRTTRYMVIEDVTPPARLWAQAAVFVVNHPDAHFTNRESDMLVITRKLRPRIFGRCNTRGRALLIVETTNDAEILWTDYRLVDFVIMHVTASPVFLTWFPYKSCPEDPKLVQIDSCFDGTFFEGFNFFQEKMPRFFNNCVFNVIAGVCRPYSSVDPDGTSTGAEDVYIRSVSEQYGLRVHYSTNLGGTFYQNRLPNGSVGGAFAELIHHHVDMAIGCMLVTEERSSFAQPLPIHSEDSLAWLVPAPRQKSLSSGIYSGFSGLLWTLVVVTALIVFTFLGLVGEEQAWELILEGVRITLGTPGFPGHHHFILRVFFIIFHVYSLHILWFYQSTLLYNLFQEQFEQPYKTIDDALDAGLVVLYMPSHEFLLKGKPNLWKKISKPGRAITGSDPDYTMIFEDRTALALGVESALRTATTQYKPHEPFNSKAIFLEKPFARLPLAVYMPFNHPLLDIFTRQTQYVLEAGLFNYWFKLYVIFSPDGDGVHLKKPLTFDHLEMAFGIWGFFLAVDCFIFIGELIFHYGMKRRFGINWLP